MDRIDYFSSNKRQNATEDLQGPVEADPEYLLIVEANNLAAQIDEEIGNFGLRICKYSGNFLVMPLIPLGLYSFVQNNL